MKYLIITFILAGSTAVAQSTDSTTIKAQANYHKRSCTGGIGFCNLSGEISLSPTGNTEISKQSSYAITFKVLRSNFTNQQQIQMIGKKFSQVVPSDVLRFNQNEDLTLDDSILAELSIASEYNVIRAGDYPITLREEDLIITLILSSNL